MSPRPLDRRQAVGLRRLATEPLVRALAGALALTFTIALATVLWRLAAGDDLKPALRAASALEARRLAGPSGLDSWGAMLSAAHRQRVGGPVYAAAMALDNCKYQYPPSALVLMELLPHPQGPHLCSRDAEAGAAAAGALAHVHWPFKRWIDVSSQAALSATIVLSFVLLWRGTAGRSDRAMAVHPAMPAAPTSHVVAATLFVLLGLTFFPLVWGHTLGQIQVHLNLVMTAALCALLAGRPALAGALLGLCCLFKPNYVLFAAWALLRREWRLAAALVLVAAAGHGVALARYGLGMHLEYLDFLRGLARLGESYWPNQSFMGLVLRWLDPASALQWADSAFGSSAAALRPPPAFDWAAAGFPDEVPGLPAAVTLSSLALLTFAFWPWRRRGPATASPASTTSTSDGRLERTLDLGIAIAAVTMASPIAWLHHYGVFFALFALALGAALRTAAADVVVLGRKATLIVALAVAYLLLGNATLRAESVFTASWPGLAGSHGLLGGLLLMAVLWRLRWR
ncbi:MAG: DUF2029 domain-containing protein [Rubrivivax sp.]|nr:DUF2029 domain-containing protein [Rubrivivax sp.]